MINKTCPKCSGKMYIDHINGDEACCINCGNIEYLHGISKEEPLEVPEGFHIFQNMSAVASINSRL